MNKTIQAVNAINITPKAENSGAVSYNPPSTGVLRISITSNATLNGSAGNLVQAMIYNSNPRYGDNHRYQVVDTDQPVHLGVNANAPVCVFLVDNYPQDNEGEVVVEFGMES